MVRQRSFLFFPGTFNPIHHGHLALVRTGLTRFEHCVLMPSGTPPHRQAAVLPARHRLAMAVLALNGMCGNAWVSDYEVTQSVDNRPSYTVDTLRWILEARRGEPIYDSHGMPIPDGRIPVLIGDDALANLPGWHQAAEVARLAWWVVYPRGSTPVDFDSFPLPIRGERLPVAPIAVSATRIRQAMGTDGALKAEGDLPPAVASYLHWNGLAAAFEAPFR